jgi:hypothetical protein
MQNKVYGGVNPELTYSTYYWSSSVRGFILWFIDKKCCENVANYAISVGTVSAGGK